MRLVSASAVEMALCIRTAPAGYKRSRVEYAVVSSVDGLSLIYRSLPISILQETEMELKAHYRLRLLPLALSNRLCGGMGSFHSPGKGCLMMVSAARSSSETLTPVGELFLI